MNKNIFLAPYPKSGNTWLRSIVITLLNDKNEFNLKDLSKITLLSDNKNFTNTEEDIYMATRKTISDKDQK